MFSLNIFEIKDLGMRRSYNTSALSKWLVNFGAAFAVLGWSSSVTASAQCIERITYVILHMNGDVYFRSDKTCTQSWCQIAWGSAEKNKNALAMLMLAKASSRSVEFYWPAIASCETANAAYASPDYMLLD
jgi:hypothetical protein